MKARLRPLLVVASVIAGCPATPPAPVSTAPPDAATASLPQETPLTAADIGPIIQEIVENDAVREIRVELARPVIRLEDVGNASPETRLSIDPPVEGQLAFTSVSTLRFRAAEPLRPGTRYKVELLAIQTRTGVVNQPSPGAWSNNFTTAKFGLTQLSLFHFDKAKKVASVDLRFTEPVTPNALPGSARWTQDGRPISDVTYIRVRGRALDNVVRARVPLSDVKETNVLTLVLKSGLKSVRGARAEEAKDTVTIVADQTVMRILRARQGESPAGLYVEVTCDDEAVPRTWYYDSEDGGGEISKSCELSDDDPNQHIHFKPAMKVTVSSAKHGFRIFGDFKRGGTTLTIDPGLPTAKSSVLQEAFEQTLTMPSRTPRVGFVSEGRYLPRKAWKSLPITHLNVTGVTLAVRQVPPENLVYWMSDDRTEQADARTSNLLFSKTIPVHGKQDAVTTSWIDVESLLPGTTEGLIQLSLSGPGAASARARILLTDIGLVAKSSPVPGRAGNAQPIRVWALESETGEPASGIDVKLIRKSGLVLARCRTAGASGCELKPSPPDEDPEPPFAIVATRGRDTTYLKFSELKTEISEADISGTAFSSAQQYTAMVYSDRGVYRPGETIHIAAIVRQGDNVAPPSGMPVVLSITDPRDRSVKKQAVPLNAAGMLVLDFPTAAFAATGRYSVTASAGDRAIGTYAFQVEEFVPERMKVSVKPERTDYADDDEVTLDIGARYLFGATPGGEKMELACSLEPAPFRPKENSNFAYGPWHDPERARRPMSLGRVEGTLDDNGHVTLGCPAPEREGFREPARVVARASVFESGSGRTTGGEGFAMVHPAPHYVGLQSGVTQAQSGKPIPVTGVVVDWQGALVRGVANVELELVRLEQEYSWYWDDEMGNGSEKVHLRPVGEGRVTVPVRDGKFTANLTPQTDAMAFLVRARAGEAKTDLKLLGNGRRAWQPAEQRADVTARPARPTWITLTGPDRISVAAPVTVKLNVPFKGHALFSVETDRLVHSEWRAVEAGPQSWTFKLDAFSPNVYASVFIAKDPRAESARIYLPDRAFGVRSITVEPAAFTYGLTIAAPDEIPSHSQLNVTLDVKPQEGPAFATVAVVDEGILSLTRFATPNPHNVIFARRALGIETFETVGWSILLPPGGPSSATGGDSGPAAPDRVQPVRPVALWSGLVAVPDDGKVTLTFPVPIFRGSLRIMAVVAGKSKMASAQRNVIVRDPIVIQTTLPRFLSYTDEFQVPVFVSNLSGAERKITVSMTAEQRAVPGIEDSGDRRSPVKMLGEETQTLTLANEKNGVVVFQARTEQMVGAARFKVTAESGDLHAYDESDVPISPAGPHERRIERIELAKGDVDLKPRLTGWVPTSETSTFWVTSNPFSDVLTNLNYLLHYPYG